MSKHLVYRSVRTFATDNKSPFLSDILARIEKINLNKDSFQKDTQKKPRRRTPNKPKADITSAGAKNSLKEDITSPVVDKKASSSADGSFKLQKIKFADHPLFSGKLDRSKFTRTDQSPRRNTQRPRTRPDGVNTSTTKGTTSRPNRSPRPKRDSKPSRTAKGLDDDRIFSRTVEPKSYSPSLTNHFLYGKPTTVQMNLTSRITSLIKSQLLGSKYPFKLPRSIIEAAPAETSNRFLLSSSSYSLELDQEKVRTEFNTIVKGQATKIAGDSNAVKLLNQNPTVNLSAKSKMASIIQEQKFHDLFKDASWKS
ncbi:hypothetical protein PSN45_000086 [Yamadazyma tenuis]|uniref:Uncharacterized protein n=1 Tax=Candida tenuis (strain ATCC 10573 / BCRC 21748 / CBS 615 / JCM 9827 / NBRC 10315 / NRRL Y-1498 / VKM Y-70) TaxID=590646 RepID=G3BAJ0_CANTC|nr:uncharacterized protein CANTEDRAFT_114893 [Yamadazyma tenuis ATCC 10573]EGV61414.1 hypothetical protein CANTEDRAFT_114893 [Yamadazyma tenuis ATCC 10573]WEJ92633.1 hypothetical protein PSN45_000086 [Yamadazyma tenuis]